MQATPVEVSGPTFDQLADLCLRYGCFQSPSLFHGVLTAQLCASQSPLRTHWVALLSQLLGTEVAAMSAQDQQLALEWLDATQDQLGSSQLDFEPLLPDDLYELEERFSALIKWIQGFTKAFQAAKVEAKQLSQEAQEGLEDLQRILAAAGEQVFDGEDNEKDMMELVEFVRLLALMLFTELHPEAPQVMTPTGSASPTGDGRIH